MRYFHGGRPGFKPGDEIRPPAETGAETLTRIVRENPVAALRPDSARRDRVYIGDMKIATAYAILWTLSPFAEGDGQVYEVCPGGEIEPDPDTRPVAGIIRAWMVPAATVTKLTTPPWPRKVVLSVWPKARELDLMFQEYKRARENGESLTMRQHQFTVLADRALQILQVPFPGHRSPAMHRPGVTLKALGF